MKDEKRINYTPKYIQDVGSTCFISKFNKKYFLYESRTGCEVPVMTGEYVGKIDSVSDPFRFIPDFPEYMEGFPTIKSLKNFYDNHVPTKPHSMKALQECASKENIDKLIAEMR